MKNLFKTDKSKNYWAEILIFLKYRHYKFYSIAFYFLIKIYSFDFINFIESNRKGLSNV